MASEFNIFKLPQKFFEADYLDQLYSLLPKGFIWVYDRISYAEILQDVIQSGEEAIQDTVDSTDVIQDSLQSTGGAGNVLRRLLSCVAAEFSRLEADAWQLLNETDPGVAVDLLPDWERVLGLPETCFDEVTISFEDRQRLAHNKLFVTGVTTTKQFYEDYAEGLGFDITVEEIPIDTSARRMGVARMGLERMGGSSGMSILQITINSGTGDTDVLRCAIEQLKQAHVVIRWIDAR